MPKNRIQREVLTALSVILCAATVALGLHVFVYRADFAPSGIDGVATMLQYASEQFWGFRINAGIFTFLLNAPLLIAAWFVLRRRYVIYTLLYIAAISVFLLLLDLVGFYQYDCFTEGTANSPVIAAVFGGCVQGITGYMLRIGSSSGGVDIIGSLINRALPHRDLERIIALASYAVVAVSFFVYGNLNAVCLSVISIFACERVSALFLRPMRGAIRFEIVTTKENAARICDFILYELRHGATVLSGQGAFAGEGREVIVCLLNHRQLPELLKFAKESPDVFLYYSEVSGVHGNFSYHALDEREHDRRLREERLAARERAGENDENSD